MSRSLNRRTARCTDEGRSHRRSWRLLVLASLLGLCGLAAAQSIDAELLDRISVSMPRAEARALLGAPDAVASLNPELSAELYVIDEAAGPLLAKGLLYAPDDRLAGHTLIFDGAIGARLSELLMQRGYRSDASLGARDGWWLLGADDDTGQAQMVQITEEPPYTILTTLERTFYADQSARTP